MQVAGCPRPAHPPSSLCSLLLPNSNGAHPLYGFRAGAWQLLCILGYIYDDCEWPLRSAGHAWALRLPTCTTSPLPCNS